MPYEVTQLNENTWSILDSGFVRMFVLAGDKEALVIDSGAFLENVRGLVESLTSLPYKLLITHSDMDHTGGNKEFESFYMHSAEAANYYNCQKGCVPYIPVEDGQVMDLGNRELVIIGLPGHTPGSIGILDVKNRALFGGDGIQDGDIFMFGPMREMHAYMHSLKKLDKYRDQFDIVYPSHGSLPVKPELIDQLYDAAERMMKGEYTPVESDFHGTVINVYDVKAAKFLRDKN